MPLAEQQVLLEVTRYTCYQNQMSAPLDVPAMRPPLKGRALNLNNQGTLGYLDSLWNRQCLPILQLS